MPSKRTIMFLIVAGSCFLGVAGVMAVVGASVFVLPTMPANSLYWLGTICFLGWLPVGSIGLVLLVLGLIFVEPSRRSRSNSGR